MSEEPEKTTAEVFNELFEETSMTAEEFDAAFAKGEPVELNVRLRPNIRVIKKCSTCEAITPTGLRRKDMAGFHCPTCGWPE